MCVFACGMHAYSVCVCACVSACVHVSVFVSTCMHVYFNVRYLICLSLKMLLENTQHTFTYTHLLADHFSNDALIDKENIPKATFQKSGPTVRRHTRIDMSHHRVGRKGDRVNRSVVCIGV